MNLCFAAHGCDLKGLEIRGKEERFCLFVCDQMRYFGRFHVNGCDQKTVIGAILAEQAKQSAF